MSEKQPFEVIKTMIANQSEKAISESDRIRYNSENKIGKKLNNMERSLLLLKSPLASDWMVMRDEEIQWIGCGTYWDAKKAIPDIIRTNDSSYKYLGGNPYSFSIKHRSELTKEQLEVICF